LDIDAHIYARDFGFNDVNDFYALVWSHKNTDKIEIPMLSLNSRDDPICPTYSIPRDELVKNENLIHMETNGGGHVEFLSKLSPRMVSFKPR
jgi:predicted alpha/beta-fold hydrolase